MKFCILLFIIFLNGCVSTNTKGPIENKTLGVFYHLNQEVNICHRHTGFTIFNNFENKYPIDEDINKIITEGYVKGIEATGNKAVEIEEGPDFSEMMVYSFWNAIPTLTKDGIEAAKEMHNKYKIDYLLVPWGFKKNIDKSVCIGASIRTGQATKSPFIPVYIAQVFDAKTGKHIGNTQIRNDNHPFKFIPPKDINNISKAEIKRYIYRTQEVAEAAVKLFISGGWKHI